MKWSGVAGCVSLAVVVFSGLLAWTAPPGAVAGRDGAATELDRVLALENREMGIELAAAPVVGDLAFLRRVMVDLIGRIPTHAEIQEFLAWPAETRREQIVDRLLADDRFADRWAAFFADMLRVRSQAEGGGPLLAYVHQAVAGGMPYDEMCRRLIATNGKAGLTPEVGWVLGDNADPMALAGAASQVFLGVRVACAECHDHPFDVWTREDFYGLAAYFGKTRRIQSQFRNRTLSIYTTEVEQTSVLWPPEGEGDASDRRPMKPRFPFTEEFSPADAPHLARLAQLRKAKEQAAAEQSRATAELSVDDLLDSAAAVAERQTRGVSIDGVTAEARQDARRIEGTVGASRESEMRRELSESITDPRNRYFSRALVNRVWNELIGRGFVDPVDDFSAGNTPSHPQTLDWLADEFVAGGFDFRTLVRLVVTSDVYRRGHAYGHDETTRQEMEAAFLAVPMRRMIAEALYDSVVTAGHLFDIKHEPGKNLKTVWQQTRIMKQPTGGLGLRDDSLAGRDRRMDAMPAGAMPAGGEPAEQSAGYNLESAIELDFASLLNAKDEEDGLAIDQMQAMSAEELEAERMQQERRRQTADYVDRFVRRVVDDNPQFFSSLRMPSPAPDGHFVRVFGQPARLDLGETRDHDPNMRQALMMLNGRLTHEAARVGEMEPIYPLLAGKQADLDQAVRLAYLEILTREPTPEDLQDAKAVINEAGNPLDGMADFRWVLLNSNEFRFLP